VGPAHNRLVRHKGEYVTTQIRFVDGRLKVLVRRCNQKPAQERKWLCKPSFFSHRNGLTKVKDHKKKFNVGGSFLASPTLVAPVVGPYDRLPGVTSAPLSNVYTVGGVRGVVQGGPPPPWGTFAFRLSGDCTKRIKFRKRCQVLLFQGGQKGLLRTMVQYGTNGLYSPGARSAIRSILMSLWSSSS